MREFTAMDYKYSADGKEYSCATCPYFVGHDYNGMDGLRCCCRFPPRPRIDDKPIVINSTNWCGEHPEARLEFLKKALLLAKETGVQLLISPIS